MLVLKVCGGFLEVLDDRDRSVIVVWSERKESQDTPEREVRQVLTDPRALQVCRDTVETQASRAPLESPEERASRENRDSQDLLLTPATPASLFKVRPAITVVLEYLVFVATKGPQVFQVFQEPRELSLELELVDCPVSQGPRAQRERKVPPASRATALKDRLGPPDCRAPQASPDSPDPLVQE